MVEAASQTTRDERTNILALEQSILNGETIEACWLSRLSTNSLLSSPLLSKAYGDMQILSGNLKEGMQFLSSSIKGLAAQGLQHQMLETFARLATLHLRTGDLVEARTILLFLQEEFERNPSEQNGLVAYTLAKGAHLLDDLDKQREYIQSAFEQYAKQQHYAAYATLLLDLWSGMVPSDELDYWYTHVVWVEQQVKLGHLSTSYIHYIKGINSYSNAKWEEAVQYLSQINSGEIGYFHAALAQVYHFRARCRDIATKRSITAEDVSELEQLLYQYEVDLELQFYLEIIKYEWHFLNDDLHGASKAKQRAIAFYKLTLLPYQSREIESLDELDRGDLESDQEVINKKSSDKIKTVTKSNSNFDPDSTEKHVVPTWRIYCFGKMQLMYNGRLVENVRWKRKKTQELFVYLLFQLNYEAPRDRVVEALFGDSDTPEKLANRLYVAIHELRQVARTHLGVTNAVIVKEGMIRLNEHMVEYLDVEQYMTLVRVGEQLWRKERDLAFEMFEQAAQLYGDLLPEVSYIDWLDQFREQLIEQQSVILQRLTKHTITEEQYDQAEWYIIQWLRVRPLQEEAHFAMIHLLLQAGRKTDALHRYHLWEQVCRQELGITPSPEIKGLILENVK